MRLLASAGRDVQAVRSSRDLPGLPSFEHEELRAVARRRTAGAAQVSLPTGVAMPLLHGLQALTPCLAGHLRLQMSYAAQGCQQRRPWFLPDANLRSTCFLPGPYTFGSFRTWEGVPVDAYPSSAHALTLLHRLAADRGIVGIMAKHKWRWAFYQGTARQHHSRGWLVLLASRSFTKRLAYDGGAVHGSRSLWRCSLQSWNAERDAAGRQSWHQPGVHPGSQHQRGAGDFTAPPYR